MNLMMFLVPWFMSVYTSWPCWETVLTIWDLLILDGELKYLFLSLCVVSLGKFITF